MLPLTDGDLPRCGRPYVNLALILATAAIFVYELTLSQLDRNILFLRFGVIPVEMVRGVNLTSVLTPGGSVDVATVLPNWVTLFTSVFIHGGWVHFAGNMLFLWVFGDNIEYRLGHVKYLAFYLLAGLAGAWLQIATDASSQVPSIGASGAIAGVLGAYLLFYPYSRVRTTFIFFPVLFFRIQAWYWLGLWFVFQLFPGLLGLGSFSGSGGIGYWAHVGGFFFGAGLVVALRLIMRERVWPRRPVGGYRCEPPL